MTSKLAEALRAAAEEAQHEADRTEALRQEVNYLNETLHEQRKKYKEKISRIIAILKEDETENDYF